MDIENEEETEATVLALGRVWTGKPISGVCVCVYIFTCIYLYWRSIRVLRLNEMAYRKMHSTNSSIHPINKILLNT